MSAWDISGAVAALLVAFMGYATAHSDDSARFGNRRDMELRSMGFIICCAAIVWFVFCVARLCGARA